MLIPLVLLLIVPSAERNEAEQLFRQMEAKVAKAKTVECTYEGKIEADKKGTMKGTLLLGEGNKVRMEINGDVDGMKWKVTVIGNGAKTKVIADIAPAQPAKDAPKWHGAAMRTAFARTGIMSSFNIIAGLREKDKEIAEFKVDEHFQVADFKLGKKEMVNKQETQVIQFTLTLKQPKEKKIEVSLWIDTKTQLPLKRVLASKEGNNKVILTETYSKFTIDGKIDPKQFELPKK